MKIKEKIDLSIDYECVENYLKNSDRYLVFARNCTWDGRSGYKFSNDIYDTVYRSYECFISPWERSKGKKTLVCKEYHHDVPMGHTSIIVALTDKEYEELSRSNFETIQRFAEEMEKAV